MAQKESIWIPQMQNYVIKNVLLPFFMKTFPKM